MCKRQRLKRSTSSKTNLQLQTFVNLFFRQKNISSKTNLCELIFQSNSPFKGKYLSINVET
jgi:hypothetical protein